VVVNEHYFILSKENSSIGLKKLLSILLMVSAFVSVLAERHKNIAYLQQEEDKYSQQKHLIDVVFRSTERLQI